MLCHWHCQHSSPGTAYSNRLAISGTVRHPSNPSSTARVAQEQQVTSCSYRQHWYPRFLRSAPCCRYGSCQAFDAMVKPDVKKNYYADLELPSDCSIDDVRKQYRKLALKYHPDRNSGKETECVPKFQAIQSAFEVLGDSDLKTKYDADRRKAGLYPRPNGRPGPTYPSGFPPSSARPPFRPSPTSPQENYASNLNGAFRYTNANFPRPQGPGGPSRRANPQEQADAWTRMNHGRQHGVPPRRPEPNPPPPPPQSAQYSWDAPRSPWVHQDERGPPKPSMPRSNTTRVPRAGFDPQHARADERQAGGASAYAQHAFRPSRPTAERRQTADFPPPPPPTAPYPNTAPPYSSQKPDGLDQFRSRYSDDDVPFTEGKPRPRMPYTYSSTGERTSLSNDAMKRSASTRNPLRSGSSYVPGRSQVNNGQHTRPRSASPSANRKPCTAPSTPDEDRNGRDHDASYMGIRCFHTFGSIVTNHNLGPTASSQRFPQSHAQSSDPDVSPTASASGSDGPLNAAGPNRRKATPASVRRGRAGKSSQDNRERLDRNAPGKENSTAEDDTEGGNRSNMYDAKFSKNSSTHWSQQWPFGPIKRDHQKSTFVHKVPHWAYPSNVSPPKAFLSKTFKEESTPTSQNQQPIRNVQSASQKADEHVHDSFAFPNRLSSQRSRSHDHINRRFSPSDWQDKFTGTADYFEARPSSQVHRKSPTKTFDNSKQRVNSTDASATQMPPPPPRPQPPPQGPPTMDGTNVPQPGEVKFSPAEWSNLMKEPSWAYPAEKPPSPNRATPKSRPPGRKQSATRARAPAVPKPAKFDATVDEEPDSEAKHDSGAASASSSSLKDAAGGEGEEVINDGGDGDAMDIDEETPVASTAQQQEPRLVSVPPIHPDVKTDTNKDANHTRRASHPTPSKPNQPQNGRKLSASGSLKANMSDLGSTAPFETTTGSGLNSVADLGATLPFESQASESHPTKSFTPRTLDLPLPPKAPMIPTNRPTHANWEACLASMTCYMKDWSVFYRTILEHFHARAITVQQLTHPFASPLTPAASSIGTAATNNWLAARGETTDQPGFDSYLQGLREDESVRAHWNTSCEKHRLTMEKFHEMREKAKQNRVGG